MALLLLVNTFRSTGIAVLPERVINIFAALPSVTIVPATEKTAGGIEVSAIATDAVDPTCVERDESEKSLIFRVSVPSVARSFARVWEKEKVPFDPTEPDPVSAPEEKSALVIPAPESE